MAETGEDKKSGYEREQGSSYVCGCPVLFFYIIQFIKGTF